MNSLPTLAFSTQYAKKLPIRPAQDRYVESNLRGVVEISDGITPDSFWPHRYLPVMFQDQTTKDGVVITKGTIVSVVDCKVRASGAIDPSSMIPIHSSDITIGEDATTSATDFITADIETNPFGYDHLAAGLLVPANGGESVNIPYSTLDETLGTVRETGVYATSSDNFVNSANRPIGIVTMDVYQDIRGKYLNYQVWPSTWGILCDKYVTVPFCDDRVTTSSMFGLLATEDPTGSTSVYYAIWKQYAFLYRKGGRAITPGTLVMSDKYGKFVPQATSISVTSATTEVDYWTAQTVGKIVLNDCRWPKGALDRVQTYPGSNAAGTDTAGVPSELYTFAVACLTVALGAAPSRTKVLDEIRQGAFGMSKIQLHVS